MATPMTMATNICAVCQEPASKRCTRCSEGLDINGQPSPTYYCGKDCQAAHWDTHKKVCKDSNERKKLFRAGEVLQAVFYAFREDTFDIPLRDITKTNNGLIHLYEGEYESDRLFVPLPERIKMDEDVKKAVLTHNTCDEALIHMRVLAEQLLKGISSKIEELAFVVKDGMRRTVFHRSAGEVEEDSCINQILIVTLNNGEEYAIDIAGAQYKNSTSAQMLDNYAENYIEEDLHLNNFGHRAIRRQKEIDKGDLADHRIQLFTALHKVASTMDEGMAVLQVVARQTLSMRSPLSQMLEFKEPQYSKLKNTTVALAKSSVAKARKEIADQAKAAKKHENGMDSADTKNATSTKDDGEIKAKETKGGSEGSTKTASRSKTSPSDEDEDEPKKGQKAKHADHTQSGVTTHTYEHGDELPDNIGSQEFLYDFMKNGAKITTLF